MVIGHHFIDEPGHFQPLIFPSQRLIPAKAYPKIGYPILEYRR